MKSKIIVGTANFVSLYHAEQYYKRQGEENPAVAVRAKIKEGSISIGQPKTKPGQKLFLSRGEGRYFIQE